SRLFSPDFFINPQMGAQMDVLRVAIDGQRGVELTYRDEKGQDSQRRVRPLGLFFWGGAWSLGAWCELRNDFRNFRLDRIANSIVLPERFVDEAGRRLADYLRAMSCEE
ncbi:MAG: WYL domain-containing protein, partial [Candidatus Obscuribacterales bacterium]|nr:WYL domain-containing protein [Steroidobacteraceae bacterium]